LEQSERVNVSLPDHCRIIVVTSLKVGSIRNESVPEVIIVGGGLAGTLAAVLLGRAGKQVALIDLHHRYPPDFRAEQLVGVQTEVLRRLGLLDILVGNVAPVSRAVATRAGRTVGVTSAPHYGIRYDDLVNRARQHLPPTVRFIKGQVVDIRVTEGVQGIALSDGNLVCGRVVVLATGFGQRLLRSLDIGRTAIRDEHSLTFGFDLEVADLERFRSSVLVAYGEQPSDGIDYLTMFSIGDTLRANLFTYRDRRDPWTKELVLRPQDALQRAMPHLEQVTGRIKAIGSVQVRVNDLAVASGYRRAGLVLVGDAFQTSCPAAGTGIGRLLNDIDRLCNQHIPKWLESEGMGSGKINQFYDDPAKLSCDEECLRIANYRRSLTTETRLRWKLHRRRLALQNQLRRLAQWEIWRPAGPWRPAESLQSIPIPQLTNAPRIGTA
jgi:2-polyprenyl-6-methoxyphenol hydroxylase-like FAD-dependent oxidoreductase